MPRGAGRWAMDLGRQHEVEIRDVHPAHFARPLCETDAMRSRSGAVVGLYALLALLAVPVFPHFLSPNEFTRWALAASLVERGTPEISSVLPLLGPAFEDVSEKDGRVFSNKAPGAALVALPGYLLARPFSGPPSASSMRPVLWAMRLFGATLPAALLALVLFHAAVRFGASPSRAASAAFALLFATPLFTYGLLLFSHALVAACLFGAWVALFLPGAPLRSFRRDLAAGALLGLAVISEYPAAVPAGVLVLCAAVPAPRRALALAAGRRPFRRPARRVRSRLLRGRLRALLRSRARLGLHFARVGRPVRHLPAVPGHRASPARGSVERASRLLAVSPPVARSASLVAPQLAVPGVASRSCSSLSRFSFSMRATRTGTAASPWGRGTSSRRCRSSSFRLHSGRADFSRALSSEPRRSRSARRRSRSRSSLPDSRCPGARSRRSSSKGD